jgi:hypothetical protein
MATIKRIGFGQVEPNHLSAQRTAQIYAQLPADASIKVLENGQFVKYNYAENKVDFSGAGEWMMVFNEVKLYDGWRETYKDFAMQKRNYTEGVMTPRVIKTNIGDIYTTNCLEKGNTSGKEEVEGTDDINVGDVLKINENGFLAKNGTSDMEFQVVKVYTLADGQAAVKVMRIA